MKKKEFKSWVRLTAVCCLSMFVLSSCSPVYMMGENRKTDSVTNRDAINVISFKVHQMKAEGLLDDYELMARSAMSADEEFQIDMEEVNQFVLNPAAFLNSTMDDSVDSEKIDLIQSLYSDSTAGEIIQKMDAVSPSMAKEFEDEISKVYDGLDDESRAALGGYKNVRMNMSLLDMGDYRASGNNDKYNWAAVNTYIAFSFTATAGVIISRTCWCFPWIRIPALVAGIVSISGMAILLGIWSGSTDFSLFYNVVSKTASLVTNIVKMTELTDAEKLNQFLTGMYAGLKELIISDPQNASNYKKILKFLDDNYLGITNLSEAVYAVIKLVLEGDEFGKKTASVLGATTVVLGTYAICYGKTVVSVLSKGWDKLVGLIPSWLDIQFPFYIGIKLAF